MVNLRLITLHACIVHVTTCFFCSPIENLVTAMLRITIFYLVKKISVVDVILAVLFLAPL